ncbi:MULTISPECIES: AbiTii domain-containing protein [Enterobacterales]|uniref:AbiTii domain-containing protein n=1 Tax=Enterobacterales TaxID=91347 RepID=UPI00236245EC|nr:abortive phage resistance protein [Serratia odorifera]EKU8635126.1 abortive phage resistance protein [Raoultella ornithinolytica]
MASVVTELQSLAENVDTDILTLLLKAKSLAMSMEDNDFLEWLNSEINGYPTMGSIPDYRVGVGKITAWDVELKRTLDFDFGKATPEQIKIFSTYKIGQSISSIRRLAEETELVQFRMPLELKNILIKDRGNGIELYWDVYNGKIQEILFAVRNRILDWATLVITKSGTQGVTVLNNDKVVSVMTVNNINNFNGNVHNAGAIGAGNTGDIHQQNSITSGDLNSLVRQLKEHGLDDADVTELEQLVKQTDKPTSKGEVEKGFGSWIGKITGKAFTGGLKIAGAAAPAVLTNALCHYFGIPV